MFLHIRFQDYILHNWSSHNTLITNLTYYQGFPVFGAFPPCNVGYITKYVGFYFIT